MALQSSGQISLANIATEFGGSAPHALSEYYGAASGVPSSGEIKLATDFYGTSNNISHSSSITCGVQSHKAGINTMGYISNQSSAFGLVRGGAATTTMGSIANGNADGNTIVGIYSFFDISAGSYRLEFDNATTNWTQIAINSRTLTRASASAQNGDKLFVWSGFNNISQVLPTSGTVSFTIS